MGFKPRQRRVAVTWDDASVDYGWKDIGDAHRVDATIVTVGYVVKRDKYAIEIAASITAFDTCAEVTRIPMGCVVRVERI